MEKILADITDFESVTPTITLTQEQSQTWLSNYHGEVQGTPEVALSRFALHGVKADKISKRCFEHPDLGIKDSKLRSLFKTSLPLHEGPSVGERGQFFLKRTNEIFETLYPHGDTKAPDQLIHVTCTGYVSPSAAQTLVSNKKWDTGVTHAYHMGCYAAMPAIRIAQGYIAASVNTIDIVHTEICSLHMNPAAQSVEQTIVQTLFADGSIKYRVARPRTEKTGFHLYHIQEKIVPDTTDQMSWTIENWGFAMTLGKRVPILLKQSIREFVMTLYNNAGWNLGDIPQSIFAVHPGGPKIIDVLEEALELKSTQLEESREILKNRGNMSSATLPHVWKRILEKNFPSGTPVVSLAFGPGLTIYGSLFRVI